MTNSHRSSSSKKAKAHHTPHLLKYEYTFEIACSDKAFRHHIGCSFELEKTNDEETLGLWQTSRTNHGTKYRILMAHNEPKRLAAKVAGISMGITVPNKVKVYPIGSSGVREAFIPVMPSVLLGERLGLPTKGYYYHFWDGKLVQEYKILGEGHCSFYATCSTPAFLSQEQGYNQYQTAILVYWKLAGKLVKNQYLIYLEEPLTRDQLDSIKNKWPEEDQWLTKNGVKLDIPTLLETLTQPAITRENEQDALAPTTPTFYEMQLDHETGQRETWPAIAEKHDLSAKVLLELNPRFDADPMQLKVGDVLTVKPMQKTQKTVVAKLPPQVPSTYNFSPNSYYQHTEKFLRERTVTPSSDNAASAHLSSTVRALNSDYLIAQDIAIVKLK